MSKLFSNVKISIKKEVYDDFLFKARLLQLYNPTFPETHQCGGFFKFKELCFGKDPVPDNYDDPSSPLNGLHFNIRHLAAMFSREFREKFKIETK